ncbi:hypothetical protein L6164_016162 [Bauhinia variegata]|uniref:Uncharacterized protein n=1 Tax=Bauhinia variegata TaxID=167791 RepID=A0ACB9NPX3_BAUVA|nr:hypothetical protein L6164_016162 [Bauhinia variegata]
MKATVEPSLVERFDEGEKEKKKKRRSNRRSKQNSASSVNEIPMVSSECSGNSKTTRPTHVTASSSNSLSKQQGVNVSAPNEEGLSRASNVSFISMPPMHINEQVDPADLQNIQTNDGGTFSKSSSEPTDCRVPSGIYTNKDLFSSSQTGVCVQRSFYSSHWSLDAIEKALEKGDVFKALFRVNAYNRLEAYCKIDGVPIDVLINGIPAQNRAVEGDTVAIKIDPLPLWTKMKGSNGTCNINASVVEGGNLLTAGDEVFCNMSKGKGKVEWDNESGQYRSCPGQNKGEADNYGTPYRSCAFPEDRYCCEDNASHNSTPHIDSFGLVNHDGLDGWHDFLNTSFSNGQNEVINAVERMCSMVNSYPSKRPTGRVVAILERSLRRETVVGHLNVRQWISYRDMNRKDAKKNKNLVSEDEYVQLTPTDAKFPKLILLVRDLPDFLKKRLQSGDLTVEMDLVAAQIDDWVEESPFPQAHILHVFGRGGEIQPQLDAILFQNAICLSEFSPEALSCLPPVPWEVPVKEFNTRMDLRNMCIFTIDPSTAIDLDDALSVEKLPNGNYRVGVHIADVSYFVLPDTALDQEAKSRSTSVYMLQRKLPMLPPLFTEDIGSLNPGVDRLAISMFLDINHAGDVVDRWIGRTVIHSCCKLSYEHAQDIIDDVIDIENSNVMGPYYPKVHGRFEWPDIITSVRSLHKISKVLKDKRFNAGALRLESSKVVLLFDEHGIPYDSMLSERKESNFLVEEFMLLANRTAAEVICRAYPDGALLRRHPEPNMRKLREFEAFCLKHGLELDTSSSGLIHQSLEQIREKLKGDSTLYDILINYATKPMQLASYFCSGDLKDNENDWGHYALAVPYYTHFTSPLRRYPDIVVHRTLLATIEAEELYLKHQKKFLVNKKEDVQKRCFTGINVDKNAAESSEGREAFSAAALKHKVPCSELLVDIAAYCNERKIASRNVKDSCDKLYMWVLLKKKELLLSEARILGLGPRFMSIYIQKLAIERRIYYDEVEGLTVEWLDVTSTLVLSMCPNKRGFRRGSPGKWRAFDEVACLSCPYDLKKSMDDSKECDAAKVGDGIAAMNRENGSKSDNSETDTEPAVFPLTVRLLSTIPVVLHAVGGDDGPLDIGVRLYMSSYFK